MRSVNLTVTIRSDQFSSQFFPLWLRRDFLMETNLLLDDKVILILYAEDRGSISKHMASPFMSVVDCRTSSVWCLVSVVVNDSLDSTAYVRFYRKLSTEEKLGKKHGPICMCGIFFRRCRRFLVYIVVFFGVQSDRWIGKKHGPIYVRRNFFFTM